MQCFFCMLHENKKFTVLLKEIAQYMIRLLNKYKEGLRYLVVGCGTTVVNFGLFWIFERIFPDDFVLLYNLLTFVLATLFAFFPNKFWVFKSSKSGARQFIKEIAGFCAGRVLSFAFEEAGLFVCQHYLKLARYTFGSISGLLIAKVVLAFVAVLINYFFSKFVVFNKEKRKNANSNDIAGL